MILVFSILLASSVKEPAKMDWSWQKPNGRFDKAALQRGWQVYKEVCSVCHALEHLSYRSLKGIGLPDAAIKALASHDEITDGPNEEGEMFKRPGLPKDKIVRPYTNENMAKAANNGSIPPDLSLMIKARPGGANYIYALLNGYVHPPKDITVAEGTHYNEFAKNHTIAMQQPLKDGQVEYRDGTKATLKQMAHDIVTFLSWAAEPELEDRKRTGLKVMFYLLVMSIIFYLSMRKVWQDVVKNPRS